MPPSLVERLLARRAATAPKPAHKVGALVAPARPATTERPKIQLGSKLLGRGPRPMRVPGTSRMPADPRWVEFFKTLRPLDKPAEGAAARPRVGAATVRVAADRRRQVGNSAEFRRVRDLPRRVSWPGGIVDVTPLVARPGGTMRLMPSQSEALVEAARQDGAFIRLGVGRGKTLISLLMPTALDARKAVLLIPAHAREKTQREIREYDRHFELPLDRLAVVTYEQLSSRRDQDILDRLAPDLVVADEAHRLRRRASARTKRFMRYMRAHPECRFVALSGTMMKKVLRDFAHLMELALRARAPLPAGYHELGDWDEAVADDASIGPGVLLELCAPGETVQDGVRRRIAETRGVISSAADELDCSLVIRRLDLDLPPAVEDLLDEVRATWSLEGDVHESAAYHASVLRQIASGFYYRWEWPGGVVDVEWVEARSAWHRAVCKRLELSLPGQDSVALCAMAADRGRWDCPEWWAWKAVKDRPEPPRVTVWLDDFLVEDAVKRARAERGTILWYRYRAVEDRLRELGWACYGSGTDASTATAPQIAASIGAQGEGKNLQKNFWRSVYTALPQNAVEAEQSFGRTHRPFQPRDEVVVEWYGHTEEARSLMDKVKVEAKQIEALEGTAQKVLYADHV